MKYLPLLVGITFILALLFVIIDPASQITVSGEKKDISFSDSYPFLIFGLLGIIYHCTVGQRVVKVKINRNHFEFSFKGETIFREWVEVENLKKYWFVAPPLYAIRFENDDKSYFFTTKNMYIISPFYVFDISEMGRFIKERKRDLPILKALRKERGILQPDN